MANRTPELLDIDAIVREKAGDKYKYFPRILINYLKRILHEDEINDCLTRYSDSVGIDFIDSAFEFLDIKLEVHGIENLPKEGLCTFVGNHPLGGPDGLAIGQIVGRHYGGNIKFMLNSFLMNLKPLAPLGIAINKMGGQARNLPRLVEEIFQSDNHILMFPAGLCSRKKNGVIRDPEWQKTFVVKSVKHHRDVVPIYFEGRNSNFFYNLANLQKILGLKFNVAMLYLCDEMFKHKGQTFQVYIGKPISWQSFDKSKTPSQWAQFVQDIVYQLGDK